MDTNEIIKVGNDLIYFPNQPLCEKENIFKGLFKGFKEVAVKRVSKEDYSDYEERLNKELNAAKQHDFESKLLDIKDYNITEQDDFYYIAYELFTATLRSVIDSGNAEGYDLKKVLYDAAQGLRNLHNQDIKDEGDLIHRDIRPENIFIIQGKESVCGKISNFALSKKIKKNRFVSTSRGIPNLDYVSAELYKSFEKINNENAGNNGIETIDEGEGPSETKKRRVKCIGRSTDIFSLGIVMFEAFTLGSHPFRRSTGENAQSNINAQKIVNLTPKPMKLKPWEIPIAMQLIKLMLHKTPNKRPRAEQVLTHPIFWEADKTARFLKAVSDHVKGSMSLMEKLGYSRGDEIFKDWKGKLEQPMKDFIDQGFKLHKPREQSNEKYSEDRNAANLLRFARNIIDHRTDRDKTAVRELLGGHEDEKFIPYILDKYPELLFRIYNQAQSFKDVDTLKEFYCINYNFYSLSNDN